MHVTIVRRQRRNFKQHHTLHCDFAESHEEVDCPSILVGRLEDNFIVFLFNVQKVLSLKDNEKRKRAITREPYDIEKNDLDKIIFRTNITCDNQ